MFKNRLAQHETYYKDNLGNYEIDKSFSAYEVFIELARDKNGEPLKNKNGEDRYYPIDDLSISKLGADVLTKKIRDDLYKVIYEVAGDKVERVERDGKRFYFVVNEDKLTTLPKDTLVVAKGEYYHTPKETGMVIVDEKDIEKPKVVGVRKFKSDNHEEEAKNAVKNFRYKPQNK